MVSPLVKPRSILRSYEDSEAPKPRDLNPTGLGRAIINRKAKDARKMQESGLVSSCKLNLPSELFTSFQSSLQTLTQLAG